MFILLAIVLSGVAFVVGLFKQYETMRCRIFELERAFDNLAFKMEKMEAEKEYTTEIALDKINSALHKINEFQESEIIIDSLRRHVDDIHRFLEICIDNETAARKKTNLYLHKYFYEILKQEYRNGNPQVHEKFRELNQAFGY